MNEAQQRYTAVAIVLHWAIAAAILSNLVLGWWMADAIDDASTKAHAIAGFQLHKSLGLTILSLSVLRLLWRLTHRPPPLPAHMPGWEKFAAKATHWAFYALMILVPLSGWTLVSAQWHDGKPINVPTVYFGLFKIPHLFDAHAMTDAARADVAERNMEAHELLAWTMAGLLVLHLAAALKHHFLNRDRVLMQMFTALDPQPAEAARRAGLRAGAAAILVALLAFGWAAVREPSGAAATASAGGAPASASGGWAVDPSSSIVFSGKTGGEDFHGKFTRWSADIHWDAASPERSTIAATVETGSADDGVGMHNETLKQGEWFDVAHYPKAEFKASKVAADGAIDGTLQIKDRTIPVTGLKAASENGALRIRGHVEIARKDVNLGQESDPNGETVSTTIGVDVDVTAKAP